MTGDEILASRVSLKLHVLRFQRRRFPREDLADADQVKSAEAGAGASASAMTRVGRRPRFIVLFFSLSV